MSILDACIEVLREVRSPLTSEQLYDEIIRRKLFEFSAKEPRTILRGTIRKHLRSNGPHRIEELPGGQYRLK